MRWWKGNTHTHSLWSDGDQFPEVVAAWYRANGYHFLALTDHDPPPPEKWVRIRDDGPSREAYEAYSAHRARLGVAALDERRVGDTLFVRLRTLAEYAAPLEEPGRFLLIPGEEITQYLARRGAHVNALNIAEPIAPQQGATLVDIVRGNLATIATQRARTGRPMIGVLNHPNFLWSQTAEDMLALPELRHFEVYNGHPGVRTLGDSLHPSTERLWDIVLTRRAMRGEGALYGIATDDAHDYLSVAAEERRPGRGWVMVRAPSLDASEIITSLDRGDFYASTGVVIDDVRFEDGVLALAIRAQPGVEYRTRFIGTRIAHDTASVARTDSAGIPVTRKYSRDVGAVLAESRDLAPSYRLRGDELYVRAVVISSRRKSNASYAGEMEMAWVQPIAPGRLQRSATMK